MKTLNNEAQKHYVKPKTRKRKSRAAPEAPDASSASDTTAPGNFLGVAESQCTCDSCKALCVHTPCWGTYEEVRRIAEAGYSGKLCFFWEQSPVNGKYVVFLEPANVGLEGKLGKYQRIGQCTFLTDEKLCQLHDLGLKPLEGRIAGCGGGYSDIEDSETVRDGIVETWNNPEAQAWARGMMAEAGLTFDDLYRMPTPEEFKAKFEADKTSQALDSLQELLQVISAIAKEIS